jgi:FAD/FMN-containing dehydrogenase
MCFIERWVPIRARTRERYESVIAEAMEAGIVKDAIVAQSQREATTLWDVRDSPGEWSKGVHWPQLGFDVSVPTGEIGPLAREMRRYWPATGRRSLRGVSLGHVADGNLHVSVRMSDHRCARAGSGACRL